MKKKILLSLTLLGLTSLAFSFTAPSVLALSPAEQIREGVETAAGEDEELEPSSLTDLVVTIIRWISIIVGAIAVIMIIWGGFRYITSAGNDSSVQAAKNTIIYAIIGLIIVALAQVIVKFVLNVLEPAPTKPAKKTETKLKDLPDIKKRQIER